MGDYTILYMFENPRRGRQARNFTTNAPKILDLKSPSEQIFSRKLPLGAPDIYNRLRFLNKYLMFLVLAPEKPATKSFQQIVTTLQQHLSPKPLEIAERVRFYKRNQHEEEGILSYVAQLMTLATHCNFVL